MIKDDKMVSILSNDEGQGFNFLMGSILGGTLEITDPCDNNKFITLEIKKSKTNTEINYYDNIVHLNKKIMVKVDFGEAQKCISLTDENISKIQETAEKNIIKSCNNVFQKYKSMGIDIFDVSEEFHRKYPKIEKEGIINKTDIEVEAKVQIMNTGDVKNFN